MNGVARACMSEQNHKGNAAAVTIGNRVEEIGVVAEFARDFGARHHLSSAVVHDLCVAFDEALSNIVKYGYGDDARHEISVAIRIAGSDVVAEIVDDGVPFDPLAAPAPRLEGKIDERPIGGLGIYLMRKLMDDVRYARRGDRNVLTMTKRIS
jgi:anti-sigma regulatory factor (Ser/Thr protein kinase)